MGQPDSNDSECTSTRQHMNRRQLYGRTACTVHRFPARKGQGAAARDQNLGATVVVPPEVLGTGSLLGDQTRGLRAARTWRSRMSFSWAVTTTSGTARQQSPVWWQVQG